MRRHSFVLSLAALLVALAIPASASAATEFALELSFAGTGEGAVSCKVGAGPLEECEAEYPEGTSLTILAEPEWGSEFTGWAGDCDTLAGLECKVTIDADKEIEAVFDLEEFQVTLQSEGSGEGVLECQVDAGAWEPCPEVETYPYETELRVYAEAEFGSEFAEWEGDCEGVEVECVLTVEEALEATAVFEAEPTAEFPLEITTEGLGEGEVSCEVNSGPAEPCEAEYEEGTEVVLVPEPETGSEFTGWGEDCSGTGACELTMDEAHAVSATFEVEQVTLTVQVEGPGSVTGPEDIDCPGVCGGNYNLGEEVELTATPDEGALFVEWTGSGAGACAGSSTPTCEVEMNGDETVKAVFEAEAGPASFTLSVTRAGTGSGTVTSSPAGISCGSTCKASFEEGTEVALTATPAQGSTFAGWSGACSGTGACKVTMSEARSATAAFTAESVSPPPPPPGEGIAKVASTAKVKSGKAQLKLSCTGEGACKGSLKLTAKVKQGKKTKNLVIGKGSFNLAKGATTTLKVKLSAPAKQALARAHSLKAKVKGSGVASSSVKLKA